jgi:hypothetical protein
LILMLAAGCGGTDAATPISLAAPLHLGARGAAEGSARVHLDGATGVATPPSGPILLRAGEAQRTIPTSDLAFAATTLAVELRTRGDGHGVVDGLALPLGDLRVYAEALPPEGLQLRELVLRLAGPTRLEIVRTDATTLTLAGNADLALDWKLELEDGARYTLGALPIGPVALRVAVTEDDAGALALQFAALCSGECGGIESLATLRDGALWTQAAALSVGP